MKEGGGKGSVSCRAEESLACQLPPQLLVDCAQTCLEIHQETCPYTPSHDPVTQATFDREGKVGYKVLQERCEEDGYRRASGSLLVVPVLISNQMSCSGATERQTQYLA